MQTITQRVRAETWVAAGAAGVVVVASFLRLSFGVDFSDEAYYVSLAYRFSLGDVPFRDELHLTQTAALITWPFVKAHAAIIGSADGLVLFTRRLHWMLACGTAATVCWALRRRLPAAAAVAISLICIAFVPSGIPNLSYNTLASLCFTLGIFFAAPTIFDGESGSRRLFGSGLFHGLAILAYPPMLIPIGAMSVAFWFLARAPARPLAAYLGGGLTVGALVLLATDPSGLADVYDFMLATYAPEGGKLPKVLRQLAQTGPSKLILLPWMALLWWQGRRRPWCVLVTLPLLPLLVALPLQRLALWQAPTHYVATWGLIAPLLLPLVWREAWVRRLIFGVWFPSLVAGVTVSWSSTNGYTNAGIGMLPAAVVAAICLHEAIRAAAASTRAIPLLPPAWLRIVPIAAVLVVVGFGLHYQRGIYMGGEVLARKRPVTTVDWGPYRGIRTLRVKNDFLRLLRNDLRPLVAQERRIIFYDHFPAGYLLTPMRPATPSIYSCFLLTAFGPSGDPDFCANHYRKTLSESNIAVHLPPVYILGNRLRPDPHQDIALDRVVKQHLQRVVARVDRQGEELYQIYASDDPDATAARESTLDPDR